MKEFEIFSYNSKSKIVNSKAFAFCLLTFAFLLFTCYLFLALHAIRYTNSLASTTHRKTHTLCRCEKRSDEAISLFSTAPLSWFFLGQL